MTVLHDYVKQNGKQFVYSQAAIDLVQQYLDKFPRVFELLNSSGANAISVSDLADSNDNRKQSGRDCLAEIQQWLQSLPQCKAKRSSLETMQLSDSALNHVQYAVHNTVGLISAFSFHAIPFVFRQSSEI